MTVQRSGEAFHAKERAFWQWYDGLSRDYGPEPNHAWRAGYDAGYQAGAAAEQERIQALVEVLRSTLAALRTVRDAAAPFINPKPTPEDVQRLAGWCEGFDSGLPRLDRILDEALAALGELVPGEGER